MSSPVYYTERDWQTDDGSLKFYFIFNYPQPYTKPVIEYYIQEQRIMPSPPNIITKGEIGYSGKTAFNCKTSTGNKVQGSFQVLEFDRAVNNEDSGIWADFNYGHNMYKSFNGVMVTFESEINL